ncbi:Carbohydrate binding domain-containing protein [Ruminococcus flavefaciens]|uniref:Carbohydrate binding domain-containing protein n=1 Tax=Ruminococcus flavefaciens TaxID=1265 RepID=A0A1H6KDH8_RUMFL|nr:glycoside hydrolase family 9 protein [Ruminococcus flavefaciens]SEH69557.1 Carbohydrate binding domain-containing protein [Ruminococcus flavefaciens]
MHKKTQKFISGIMSLAMLASSASAYIAPLPASAVQVLGETSFENKSLPWHICSSNPAKQSFNIEDGAYHIQIRVPEGSEHEKWDLQFRHRGLNFRKGHEYKVSFKVKGNRYGMELCSFIGTLNDLEEYFVLDGEESNMHMGPHMGGQWALRALELTTEWQTIEGIFKPTEDIEGCQWTFQYAKGTKYQGNAKEGDEIWFDDMSIECLTCDEDPGAATCGWTGDSNYGLTIPKNDVRINQLGYYTTADKKATYVTEKDKESIDFKLVDKDGKTVFTGKSEPAGYDEMAGEYCHIVDFSKFDTPGVYTIVMDDEKDGSKHISHEFSIGDDIYKNTLRNALNYYYQKRSGSDVEAKYVTSGDKNKVAHKDFIKTDTAYVQPIWYKEYYGYEYNADINKKVSLDVSGGWYDPENHCKSISSGGNAVWLLQNMYERSKKNGTDGKWADGRTMSIPNEYSISNGTVNCADTPDILDEARYELEFMFRMIVDSEKDSIWGEKYGDFVYDRVRNLWSEPVPYAPLDYIDEKLSPRLICPPTYSATFNMIACAAQAARLWKGIDDDFAQECLDHAKRSWEAIMKYKDDFEYKPGKFSDAAWEKDVHFVPFTSYHDTDSYNSDIEDEAYWAACELFATTGDETYYDYLKDYKRKETSVNIGDCSALDIPLYLPMIESQGIFSAFDRNNKVGCGTLSLYLSDKTKNADKAAIKKNITDTANKYLDLENDTKTNGMGVPYKEIQWLDPYTYPQESYAGYGLGSNSTITNNALIMAYAYDATDDKKYLNGALQAVDYIFGRNALGFSYVTGCGSYHAQNPVDEYWGYELDKDFPKAPDGIMAGGPYTLAADMYVRSLGLAPDKTSPQKSYADSIEAWSVNSPALDWQAGLVWDLSFFEDILGKAPEETTTTTTVTSSVTTTTTTTTTVTTTSVVTVDTPLPMGMKGDANCDGQLDMSDVVLIMQALANPNKYGINGTAETHLTKPGEIYGDMNGDGLTVGDALNIQKILLGLSID